MTEYKKESECICAICNEDASDNANPRFDAYPGYQCCKKHIEYMYIPYFMLPFLRKELGLPYILKSKIECCVCRKELTEIEVDAIRSSEANFYCTTHQEVKFIYAFEWARAWFLYKENKNISDTIITRESKSYQEFNRWFIGLVQNDYDKYRALMFNGKSIHVY